SVSGAGDYDWGHSKLKERLRNNRMPPGWEFDITEENRDGPWVLHGMQVDDEMPTAGAGATAVSISSGACEVKAVNLIGDWVNAGAPEALAFAYTAENGISCGGTFSTDILPLFTEDDIWFDGAQACTGCHFANSENSYHEMDLSSYEGILAGADVLEEPPGVSLLGQNEPGVGDYDWSHSKLRERLRNNRMPPGWEFDITEENRDGPTLTINGTDVRAVDLLADWVNAGVPETAAFGDYDAVFADNVLPLFTEDGVWFDGSQACTGCHFANSENSYHEMDLSSYEGILAGADVLEEPPGVSILGESEAGAGDYDWSHSKLKERLRNNRMPPGWEFDITEENRDGALVMHGARVGAQSAEAAAPATDSCAVKAVNLLGDWVNAGAPEGAFSYAAESGDACDGTFDANILPLFTENGVWFDGAQACTGCHFANSENSYHEMDLSSYEGVLAGADVLEEPPGVSILGESEAGAGDYDWSHSKLRERLRNNRMPPGWEFDITEENRDGPTLTIGGTEVRAVDLLADWVNAGVPELDTFGEYSATFTENVLPLFTENGAWFDGSQACTGCHFANSENSYHEMDLTTYEGILAGADVLEEPPGVSILGESEAGAGDFDWSHSKLRERLRNNRMPPGWEFDITEENRDGPLVSGSGAAAEAGGGATAGGDCAVNAVNLISDWVNAGVPETEIFSYAAANGTSCDGTFEANILPLFTENGVWFDGAQACTGCHFANSENSYHEMDLTSYEGILAGADVLEEPPGVSILGESEAGAGDYDWSHSKL
ncbi:MAG: hypothetical protein GY805_08700, partial [Chloroflexi bacterium]|nr:hypothetical protein [Chloroflexota bacterium]